LTDAGIEYAGAGRDLNEAMEARYFGVNGIMFAYVAATRAEKFILTPAADENSPGVLRTYDSALFLNAIKKARAIADVVIAVVHWGTEYSYELEDEQTALAKEIIGAGADMIVGSHPHCLQGIEFYNGKPIIYSLGNFWFNGETIETALLEVTYIFSDITSDTPTGELALTILPCMQTEMKTVLLTDEAERREVFDLIESISPNADVSIGGDGRVTQIKG
jgi:poly-gamma-glutamate synthesis protein (capsule biosynthesis protein)